MAGPLQFNLNAGVSRTFFVGDRLNLDWRVDATNVLNRVTFAGVNTISVARSSGCRIERTR